MNAFTELLLSNLVITAVLAPLVAAITRIWRDPHLAYALWLLVLIKMVTPPFIEVPFPIIAERVGGRIEVAAGAESSRSNLGGAVDTGQLLVNDSGASSHGARSLLMLGLWLTVMLGIGVVSMLRLRRLSKLLKAARPADQRLKTMLKSISDQMGIRHVPDLKVSAARIPPFVTSNFGRQTILLPMNLVEELDHEQCRSVLAHELAHVKRGDRWGRLFELVVLGVFWWNPVVWWASRNLRYATEECCDALVIWVLPESRRSYGTALLRTVEFISNTGLPSPFTGTTFGVPFFKNRIETIMKKQTYHRMSLPVRALVLVLGLAALPFSATSVSLAVEKPEKPLKTTKGGLANGPITWEHCVFEISSKEDKIEALHAKISSLTADKTFKSSREVLDIISKNGVRVYSVRLSSDSEMDFPDEVKKIAGAMKMGEVSHAIRVGTNYHVLHKMVDEEAIKKQREYSAQLRLLQLDVKAAKIRWDAAREKSELLVELAKQNTASNSESRAAMRETDLAEIDVERAEIAVELFEAQNSHP